MKRLLTAMAVVGLAMAAQGEGSYVPPEGTETPAASREVRAEAALLPGDLRPGEVAEAPDAEAKATVGTYMDALAAGDWSKALFFVDVATLRKSLLERRLADLKAHNAGMSAKDLEEISATLQTRELDPGRVRGILAELWAKDGMKGMEWKTAAWRDIGELEEGAWLARVACRTTEGANKDVLVCLRKDEDGWMVATDLADRIFAAQPRRVAVPAEVPLPEAVKELAEGYWTDWRAGNWAGVRARMSERNREALDADVFAARCEALALQMGIPSEWKLEHCKQLRPGMLGLGYAVSARSEYQALMIAVMGPEGWALEDVQVRRAEPAPAAVPTAAPGGAARPYSSDFKAGGLKSDFKTKL